MKVYVRGRWYDGSHEPVAAFLDPNDHRALSRMLKDGSNVHFYYSQPTNTDPPDLKKFQEQAQQDFRDGKYASIIVAPHGGLD